MATKKTKQQTPLWDRPTFLYRYFSDDRELLYVGITDDWEARSRGHRKTSNWFADARHVEIERYSDRHQAFAAESWAIAYERPLWNYEEQLKHCPFILPTPEVAFGRLNYARRRWMGF